MDETIVLTGVVNHTTEKAILLKGEGGRPADRWKLWIPRSVITEETDDLGRGDLVDLSVAKWWAEQEGLD